MLHIVLLFCEIVGLSLFKGLACVVCYGWRHSAHTNIRIQCHNPCA